MKGVSIIGKPNSTQIENVHYIKGLKHNLISISQLCDNGYEVKFEPNPCLVKEASTGKIIFLNVRERNLYRIYLESLPSQSCLAVFKSDKWIGHKRVGHLNMKTLSKHNLVRDQPNIKYEKDRICEACVKGKKNQIQFPP